MGKKRQMVQRLSLLALFIIALCALPARAMEPYALPGADGYAELSNRVEMLRDPSRALTFQDVSAGKAAAMFAPADEEAPNIGFTKDAVWSRFSVTNPSNTPLPWRFELACNLYEHVTVYRVTGGGVEERIIGQRQPYGARDFSYRNFVLRETLPPRAAETYYVRIVSDKSIFLRFQAWTPEAFTEHSTSEYGLFGLYFGIMVVMLAYNLFLHFALRDNAYLHYVLYVFFVAFTMLSYDGFGYQYLWPNNVWFEERSITIFYCIAYFFGMQFSRIFLDTPANAPRFDRLLKGLMGSALVILAVVVPFAHQYAPPLINLLSIFLALLLATGFTLATRGYRPAIYFVLAWTMFLSGLSILALKHFAVLPVTFATEWSFQIGSAMEVILLSLALGDRISIMREEKEKAQAMALEQEKIATAALTRNKEELERLVEERTTELRAAKDKAEDATRLKDHFISLVSHDLRSPLSSLMGAIDILAKGIAGDVSGDQKQLLDKMGRNVGGLLEMLQKLLDVSRLKSGRIELTLMPLNAAAAADAVIGRLETLAAQKNIRLRNELPGMLRLIVDHPLFYELLQNLLTNAIKFSHEGGTVSIHSPAPFTIAVHDEGVGIPEDALEKLFFHNAKKSSDGTAGEKGTGLGLPFCRDIMHVHGGDIRVETKPGRGSTFTLIFPDTPVTVLLAVADARLRAAAKARLLGLGLAVKEAPTTADALTEMGNGGFHLMIAGMEPPSMNALRLAGIARSGSRSAHLPIIIIGSAGAPALERGEALNAGASEYLAVLNDVGELDAHVCRFCG